MSLVSGVAYGEGQDKDSISFSESNSTSEDVPVVVHEEVNLNLLIDAGNIEYQIKAPQVGDDLFKNYIAMPENEKSLFLKNRKMLLPRIAKLLHAMRFGFGFGSVVGDKISMHLEKRQQQRLQEFAAQMPAGVADDVGAAVNADVNSSKNEPIVKAGFAARSREIVQAVLTAIDRRCWQQARLFAHANEFGFMLAGGVQALGGDANHGWGGLHDIGLSLGVNWEQKSLVLQVFHDSERYQSSIMPAVFIAGLVGKAGFYLANQDPQSMNKEGISYYPPMMPGFSSQTDVSFVSGGSSGLTWPPSPLGDMLTYTNRLEQRTLVRFTVSPMLRGFVRVQMGIGLKEMKATLEPVVASLQKLFSSRIAPYCANVL